MRSIKIALALVFVAASAHAEPAVYPGLIPDYQKLEPSGAYVFNATDGQWHANSSTNPLYCSVPSGGNGGTVDLTKLNGTTVSTSNPLPTSPVWCPTAALTKISTLTTLTANTANQSVSAGCAGACAKVSCINGSSVLVLVRPAGATNYIPLGPYGSVEFTGVAACEFSTQTPADTTATPAASAMGCDDA